MSQDLTRYGELLTQIKDCIRRAQVKATLSANAEMILMYWDIGRMIHERQQHEGWGAKVIPQLSRDIRNELPEIKGFSERNLKRMIAFYREYPLLSANGPQAVAQLPSAENDNVKKVPQAVAQLPASDFSENLQLVAKIPWGHHILLMEKIKDLPARLWYMRQTIEQGWSRNVLGLMIKSNAHKRQGAAVTNFEKCLPDPQSDQARQALKDPYIFDFLTLVKKINKKRSLDQQFGTFFNAENDYGYEQEKHLGNINIMIDKITSCEISFNSGFDEKHAMLSLLDDYFFIDCNLLQDGDDLIKMSPGKRGIILFQLFLHLSKSKNPILIDQPEDNLDNRTVYQELNGFIKTKKSTRQIIIVSHNPNLVVSTDSENIIVANQDGQNKSGKNNTFKFEYVNGAIEHSFDKDRINLAERFKRLSPETVITIL